MRTGDTIVAGTGAAASRRSEGAFARARRRTAGVLACLFLCVAGIGRAQAQIVPDMACDGRMWVSQDNQLFHVRPTTAGSVAFDLVMTIPAATPQHNMNAGDVNPADGNLYYIRNAGQGNTASAQLWRVSGSGTRTNLGAVSGLPVAGNPIGLRIYISGGFTPAGNILYVLHNQNPQAQMYAVDVTTQTAALIPLSSNVNISDIAYTNGAFYAIQPGTAAGGGQMKRIGLDGTVTNVGSPNGATGNSHIGGMIGAPNGLFGIRNDGGFYQFDVNTGAALFVGNAINSSSNDAYHCPSMDIAFTADLGVTKTNTPASGADDLTDDTYVPGQARSYDIVITNHGPFGAQNQNARDLLPAGITAADWTCAVVGGSPTGTSCGSTTSGSVTGATQIDWTGIDLPVGGAVRYSVALTVPAGQTGDLVNEARVLPTDTVIDGNPANDRATDTDQRAPQVTVAKTLADGTGTVNTFNFTLTNVTNASDQLAGVAPGATATSTVTHYGTVGQAVQVTETSTTGGPALSDYTTTSSCRETVSNTVITGGNTGFHLAGANLTADSRWVCTFVNTRRQADVQVVKTAAPDPVLSGAPVTYTIAVTNNGPMAADNAVLTDTPGPGQTCTAAVCSAGGGATCPAGGTAGEPINVAALTAAGVTLPSLPMGGTVTVTMTCTATASGLP